MQIKILKNKIIIKKPIDFNIEQILNCGQIFRYTINENVAKVYSRDKMAEIYSEPDAITIKSKDINYFYHFFDLDTDYSSIKKELYIYDFLKPAIDFGYGIRILKNDPYEIIVSFIISANNNITRIKRSIKYLCENFGNNCGDYYAFPTLNQLKKLSIEDFEKAGLGYRSKYMFETIQTLTENSIHDLKNKTLDEQREFLLSLKGVGEKVANCILLFGLNRQNVFPVDTWINKVYANNYNSSINNRKKITHQLEKDFKNLSGYAQQYLFYYYRENKLK